MACLLAMAACTSPEKTIEEETDQRKAVIQIAPPASRANGGAASPDELIECLRVMVFNEKDGSLAYNKFTDKFTADYKVEMMTGAYDFVFIANERPKSASLTAAISAKLNQVRHFRELENIGFTSADISEANPIPMLSVYRDVKVEGNNKLSGYAPDATPFSLSGGSWNVEVKRAAIRVDMTLTTASDDLAMNFSQISASNIPKEVPLLSSVYSRPEFDAPRLIAPGEKFQKNASGAWVLKYDRLILPASHLPNADSTNAITFNLQFNGYPDLQGALMNGPMPRNELYILTGTVKEKLNFTAEVKEWKPSTIVPQWLYVDSIDSAYVLNGKKHRIRIHAEYDWTAESGDRTYLEIEADSAKGKRGKSQWVTFNLERTYSNDFNRLDYIAVPLVFYSKEGGRKIVELPTVTFPASPPTPIW
jgi:hypothetical protein